MKPTLLLTALAGGMFAAAAFAADAPLTNALSVADTNAPSTNAVASATNALSSAPDQSNDQTPQPPSSNDQTATSAPSETPTSVQGITIATNAAVSSNVYPINPAALPRGVTIIANVSNATSVGMSENLRGVTPTSATNPNAGWALYVNDSNVNGNAQSNTAANGQKGLRMNFRGVPLEAVLNYMSDAAGFIIHPKVDIHGKVDAWSNQPLTSDEAVKLLKQVLNENGYTVIQDGRELTIISTSEAKNSAIPVRDGNKPEDIPRNADIVTQIIPVHSLNVVELVKTLQPLMPSTATLAANESANSLVITDTQINIHRMVEIIHDLDTVTSSSATIKVFPLKYADSKSLASLIKDLFSPTDTSNTRGGGGFGGGFGRLFRGGGFGGGGGGGGGNENDENGHTPTAKVTAVSDDHSNSLIVSAPDSLINDIAELVKQVDMPVEDTTDVQIFHLNNADPTEMADLITSLFPTDTSATQADATRSPFRFGFGFGGPQPASSKASQSERLTKMSSVTAVADRRTASLIVTAGKDLMPEISVLVKQLDSRSDRKQIPHVIPLANADPIDVVQILQDIFPSSSSSSSSSRLSSSSSSTSNPLLNRQQTLLQQQNSTSSSSFGSGTGGSGGTGSRGF